MAAGHWGLSVRRVHKSRMEEVKYALQEGALAVVICKEYSITGSGKRALYRAYRGNTGRVFYHCGPGKPGTERQALQRGYDSFLCA